LNFQATKHFPSSFRGKLSCGAVEFFLVSHSLSKFPLSSTERLKFRISPSRKVTILEGEKKAENELVNERFQERKTGKHYSLKG